LQGGPVPIRTVGSWSVRRKDLAAEQGQYVQDCKVPEFYRGFGEFYRKNWEEATRELDRAYELDSTLYTQIGKVLGDSIAHKNSGGLEILRRIEKTIQQREVGDPEGTYKIAQAYAVLGDNESALRVLRYTIENGFFSYPYFMTDPSPG